VKPRANGRSPVTCNTNNHGSGLSPGPPPFPIITTHDFKYKRVHIIFKEHRRESWLAECYEVVGVGGGPGVEPRGPQYILYKNHLANKRGTRGAHGLGHVSSHYSPTTGHVSSTDSPETNQTTTHHVITVWSVRPCHVTVRTVRTGTVSTQKFCLFGLADRSRYLLHTDSVCESKYTAGIRKTRRTQWHYFRRIPSTLKIEQNLIP
jgi:hypothetical protein